MRSGVVVSPFPRSLGLLLLVTSCGTRLPLEEGLSPLSSTLYADSVRRTVPSALRTRFTLTMPEGPSVDGRLILEHPGRLRLEIMGPLGTPEVSVVADRDRLAILSHPDRTRMTAGGTGDPELAEELALWTEFLTGQVPDLPAAVLFEDEEASRFVAEGAFGLRLDVSLEPTTRTPHRVALALGHTPLFQATYGPFSSHGTALLPERIDVRILEVDLGVRYAGWEIPPEIPPRAFSLDAPEGYLDRVLEEDTASFVRSMVLSSLLDEDPRERTTEDAAPPP